MIRKIHFGDGNGEYFSVPIDDNEAQSLVEGGILYHRGEDFDDHGLQVNPRVHGFHTIERLLRGIALAENKVFTIGDTTMQLVFKPAGIENMSDIQAIMNEVEAVIEGLVMDADKRLTNPHGLAGGPLPPLAANAHGIGPDEGGGPNPDYDPDFAEIPDLVPGPGEDPDYMEGEPDDIRFVLISGPSDRPNDRYTIFFNQPEADFFRDLIRGAGGKAEVHSARTV